MQRPRCSTKPPKTLRSICPRTRPGSMAILVTHLSFPEGTDAGGAVLGRGAAPASRRLANDQPAGDRGRARLLGPARIDLGQQLQCGDAADLAEVHVDRG